MTKITIYHVQRAITPKVCKPKLWFLCYACHLMVVNISVKFRENILNGKILKLQGSHNFITKITIYKVSKGVNSKCR